MKRFLGAMILSCILFVSSCSGALPQPDKSGAQQINANQMPASDVYVAKSLRQLPAVKNSWTIPGESYTFAVSSNANTAAVVNEHGEVFYVNVPNHSFQKSFRIAQLVPGKFSVVGSNRLAFITEAANERELHVTDLQGKVIWQRGIQGSPQIISSADGERVLLLNHERERARLFDGQGNELASRSITHGASAQFNGRDVLLRNGREIIYFDQKGNVKFSYNINNGPAPEQVTPGSDGSHFAITTKDGDPTLYVFDNRANLLWNARLLAGLNKPVFSPSGDGIVIMNKGSRLELQYFNISDPALVWRTALAIRDGQYAAGQIDQLTFLPSNTIRAYYKDSNAESYLVDFTEAGQLAQTYKFEAGTQVYGNDRYVLALGPKGTLRLYDIPVVAKKGVGQSPTLGRR